MTAAYVRRPFLLSLVTILMILSGVLSVIAGISLAIFHNNDSMLHDSGESSSTLLTLGLLSIVFGLVSIWFASALRHGSRFARAVALVYEVIQIVGAVWALIALHSQYRWNAVLTILISLLVIWYLYANQRSREFFGDPA